MKTSPFLRLVLLAGVSLLAACQSAQNGILSSPVDIKKKADAYRSAGAAPSMIEAQRMAENYYWPENVRTQEEQQRQEAAARAAKP
jgi:hypothetical protein